MPPPPSSKRPSRPAAFPGSNTFRFGLLALLSLGMVLLLAACASHSPSQSRPDSISSPPVAAAHLQAPTAVDVRHVRRALTAEEAKAYLGDAVCASCHKDVAVAHNMSRHAHTLRPVSVDQDGRFFRATRSIADKSLRYVYSTAVAAGKCLLQGRNGKGKLAAVSADYVMGSGNNAYTYLNRDDPTAWTELRLSYYPKAGTWDFTPTQLPGASLVRAAGRAQSDGTLTGCLLCHVTVLRLAPSPIGTDGLPVNHPNPDMQASLLGVGCERCHGPGRAHVEQATQAHATSPEALARAKVTQQRYGMENLKQATPEMLQQICGVCHRSPANAADNDPHVEMNLPRFQGLALARSACFQRSGVLSCVTCHGGHANADPSLAHNDAICLQCHSRKTDKEKGRQSDKEAQSAILTQSVPQALPAKQEGHGKTSPNTVCPVNPRAGCTGCHMPRQSIADIPHVRYTNHWIKVWPKQTQNAFDATSVPTSSH